MDLIETTDGSVYFIELNFRAGASIHAFTEAGINLPGMLANYFTGKTVDWEEKDSIPGKTFVSEKVLLEEFARSDVSLSQLRRKLSEADIHFIKNRKDPKPYKKFRKYYFVAALMRIPYQLRDLKRKGN